MSEWYHLQSDGRMTRPGQLVSFPEGKSFRMSTDNISTTPVCRLPLADDGDIEWTLNCRITKYNAGQEVPDFSGHNRRHSGKYFDDIYASTGGRDDTEL